MASTRDSGKAVTDRVRAIEAAVTRVVRRAPWLFAAAASLIVFLWAAGPLTRGQLGPIWDSDAFFAPFYSLVADFARHGRLLSWNPWSSGGSPDFAEPQVGATSPLMLLSALLTGGSSVGFRAHWLATWFAGLLGVMALARRLGVSPLGGFLVALGFAFSGPFTGNAEHMSFIRAFVLLPFIIERVEKALTERRFLPAAQAGALWGLTAMGGYPALVFFDVMFVGLWIMGRWLFRDDRTAGVRRPARELRRFLTLAIPAGVLGVVILLPPFIGMLTEGNGYSTRTEPLARDLVISSNALGPRALLSAFSPYLGALPPTLWPATDISSADVYFGALNLFFALCALVGRPRSGWRWWLLGMAMFFFGLSVGPALPLRGWLYDLVPPTRFFRHPSAFRLPAIFALVALALEGAKDLLGQPRGARNGLSLLLAATLLSGTALWSYLGVSRVVATPAQDAGDTHFVLIWSGVLVVAALLASARANHPRRATLGRVALALLVVLGIFDAERSFALTMSTVGSAGTAVGWRALDGVRVTSVDLLAHGGAARMAIADDSTGLGPGPTNKNLLVKRASFMGYPSLKNPMFERWASIPALLNRVLPEQRIYFSPQAVTMDRTLPSFDAFSAYVAGSGAFPLVIDGGHGKSARAAGPPPRLEGTQSAQPVPAHWTVYDPDHLVMDVTAPADGWLLVTDRWAPGWSAKIDGRPVTVEVGDFLFRAVRITAGRHDLEMRYRPWGHPWVVALSWSSLLAVAAATAAAVWRGRAARPLSAREPVQFQLDGTDPAA